MKKIGFVTPWYGENIPGGAESMLRDLVKHLAAAGVALEVLTTCVEKFQSDWNVNFHKPGLTEEGGVPVRRFPADPRNTAVFDRVNGCLIRGERITLGEEEVFQREMVNSRELYRYMEGHREEYALFVFIPYMFGTTYFGCRAVPEKSVLIPCLHDEAYAYMGNLKEAFSRVRGMIFLSEAERELALRLYDLPDTGNYRTLGGGVALPEGGDGDRFRETFGIRDPYILYAGRKDAGKKADVLVRYFAEYKRRHPSDLKLVLIGGGKMDLPSEEIIDLGFVSEQDKRDAYAGAALFCNPSQFESFSIVIMESWLAGRPVLVNGDCAVTRSFVSRADGGLYYRNYPEFDRCVTYLLEHGDIADRMGQLGARYVREHFEWSRIVENYTAYFREMSEA